MRGFRGVPLTRRLFVEHKERVLLDLWLKMGSEGGVNGTFTDFTGIEIQRPGC